MNPWNVKPFTHEFKHVHQVLFWACAVMTSFAWGFGQDEIAVICAIAVGYIYRTFYDPRWEYGAGL